VFTFTGINVIDLQSGTVRTIASSIPRQLAIAGGDLLVLDTRSILVYDDARTLVRRQTLPADAVALEVSGTVAVLATNEGVAAVSRTTAVPHAVARFANNYYSKVVTGGDYVYLFGKEGVDVFTAASSSPLRYVTGIRTAGAIDVAATDTHLYTLSGNGTLSVWSPFGARLGQRDVVETDDSQPLSIATARGAVWVSLVTGCATGQCARKTVVVDPATLVVTATMTGALRDLAVSGTRAYALFDHPNEMRVLDLSSPLQPSLRLAAPRPATATSIAYELGRVHVLGDKLYTFNETSLTETAQRFTAVTPEESQRIRIDGGCALITGRGDKPALHALPSWTAASSFDIPSTVRSIAMQNGRTFLLTGHSVEVWSTLPAPPPARRRRSVR
ncbi:MAG TPA: hypothetical protein VE010_19010, partial [Thermoanaerobaculia bacterium]|nr:hypothetical protein [Thermoanaerobaculia bacterium]